MRIIHEAEPVAIHGNGTAQEVEFARTGDGAGERFRLRADQVLKAIGQRLEGAPKGLQLDGGKIAVTGEARTSLEGVWAGGDCTGEGEDLTVTAVAQGRDAAEDIHAALTGATRAATGAVHGEAART